MFAKSPSAELDPDIPDADVASEPRPPVEPAFVDAGVPPRRENTTYFAKGTVIEGTLRSDKDVEIVGDFSGEIASEGKVTLHAGTVSSIAARQLELIGSTLTGEVTVSGAVTLDAASSITGNIRAASLDSAGKIRGNLAIRESVSLRGDAGVTGDVRTPSLSMDRGVTLNGTLDMSSSPA